ncbi:unnamed protein product [Somion occarium]|uniref:3'-5' exonuclease domain-containing protein n=1 Tax=Somion occarium TaxID=3059160 RepID=A0ABP1DNR8_9APHY
MTTKSGSSSGKKSLEVMNENKANENAEKEMFNASHTFITTYNQLNHAALVLSKSPYLVVDCEGQNLAQIDGRLSFLAIGTAQAREVFVIDVLCINNREEHSVAALLALLTDESIPKMMWDGRGDYLEILLYYGVSMQGVWDLQVAEVASRSLRRETDDQRLGRIVYRAQYGWKAVRRDRHLFEGIHMVEGLNGVVAQYNVGDNLAKDAEVVAMHKAGGSERWMRRPLPDRLVQYAANDIYLIAMVYTFFIKNCWILPELQAQSARYIFQETTREQKDLRQRNGAGRYLPLGVLSDPALSGPLYECLLCTRSLDLSCYETTLTHKPPPPTARKNKKSRKKPSSTSASQTSPAGSGKSVALLRRKPCCRLCVVCAMKSGMILDHSWVDV